MKSIKLKSEPGNQFDDVAKKAKKLASKEQNVEFDFNGVKCIVSRDTNLKLLYRDYSRSWLMGWKTVGPDLPVCYSPELQAKYELRTKEQEEKRQREHLEQMEKEQREREAFENKTKGIEISILDNVTWDSWKAKNTDPYGECIFNYAEAWAKLMEAELKNGVPVSKSFESTSHELGFFGITGYMYGAAVGTLAQCWKYGEELRKAHNKQYKHDGDGVVNPAILTIG